VLQKFPHGTLEGVVDVVEEALGLDLDRLLFVLRGPQVSLGRFQLVLPGRSVHAEDRFALFYRDVGLCMQVSDDAAELRGEPDHEALQNQFLIVFSLRAVTEQRSLALTRSVKRMKLAVAECLAKGRSWPDRCP